MKRRGYIDIETTGLSRYLSDLTVVGVAVEKGGGCRLTQLLEQTLTARNLLRTLEGIDELYSYNGSRFDLPFIKAALGVDLKSCLTHTDLMYACWRRDLKGGLKAVEKALGIKRELTNVNGRMAVVLWRRYVNYSDTAALETLLKYNAEDVLNLRVLRKKLAVE